MADIRIRRSIQIEAETVGDVAKWIAHVEGLKGVRMTTPLLEPVHLTVDLEGELQLDVGNPADR